MFGMRKILGKCLPLWTTITISNISYKSQRNFHVLVYTYPSMKYFIVQNLPWHYSITKELCFLPFGNDPYRLGLQIIYVCKISFSLVSKWILYQTAYCCLLFFIVLRLYIYLFVNHLIELVDPLTPSNTISILTLMNMYFFAVVYKYDASRRRHFISSLKRRLRLFTVFFYRMFWCRITDERVYNRYLNYERPSTTLITTWNTKRYFFSFAR